MTTQTKQICLLLPNCNHPPRGIKCLEDTKNDLQELIKSTNKSPKQSILKLISHPFFWGFVFMIICGYWNGIFQVITQKRYDQWIVTHPQANKEIVIADAAFDIIPKVNETYLPELCAALFMIITLVRFFVTPYRWIILRRFFFLQGIIYFLQGICIFTTVLPDPSGRKSTVNTNNVLIEGLLVFLGIHKVQCNMMFSGVAASLVLCACIWHHYSHKVPLLQFDVDNSPNATPYGYPLRMTLVKCIMWIATVLCLGLYVACRLHYIADVFVGFVFSLFLFKLYHNYILFCSTRDNLINSFFKWFESDATDIPAVVKMPMESINTTEMISNQ